MRLVTVFLSLVLMALLAGPATAARRVPQVPVLGSVLQSVLDSMHAGIDVNADQLDRPVWQDSNPADGVSTWLIELVYTTPGASVGIYLAADPARRPYELFPDGAGPHWFSSFGFRRSPDRLFISTFDEQGVLIRTNQVLGLTESGLGFYLTHAGTVLYSEDVLNAGGAAQWLSFFGVALDVGNVWLAAEATPIASGASDQGYDDVVLYLESSQCNCTPTQRSSWGALKQRFR